MKIDKETEEAIKKIKELSKKHNVAKVLQKLRNKMVLDLQEQQMFLKRFVRELTEELRKCGFDKKRRCMYVSSAFVFLGRNFVLKANYIVGSKPKRAVPTENFRCGGLIWRIQPRCIPISRKNWHDISKYLSLGPDGHSQNVMVYEGRLVLVDW